MQRGSSNSNPLPGTSSSRRGSNANNNADSVEQNADPVHNNNSQVLEQPNVVHEHEQQGLRLPPPPPSSSSSDGNANMSEKWLGKRPMVEEPRSSERTIIRSAAGPYLSLSQSDGISDHHLRIPPNLDLNISYDEWVVNENTNHQEAELQGRNIRRRRSPGNEQGFLIPSSNMSNSTPQNSTLSLSSRRTTSPRSSSRSATVSSFPQPGSGSGSGSTWLDENWRYVPRRVSLQDILGHETEQRASSIRNPISLGDIQASRSTIDTLLATFSSTFSPPSRPVVHDPSRTNAAVCPVPPPPRPSSAVEQVIIISDEDDDENENNNVNEDHQNESGDNESEDVNEDHQDEPEEVFEEENEELDDMRLDVDAMSYEELTVLQEVIGHVGTGLAEAEVLNGLRRGTCQSNRKGLRCNICLEDYAMGDQMGILHCRHAYHYDCIKQWLVKKNRCPVCKTTGIRKCAACGCT